MKYTKKITEEKIKMVENFTRSVKSLSASQPMNQITEDEYLKKDIFKNSMTCYYLSSLMFELLIKVFYEIEKDEICKKTHDLEKIYKCLSDTDKEFIQDKYKHSEKELKAFIEEENKKLEAEKKINTTYCNLNEALKLNKDIVRDFKYDMNIKNGAAIYTNLFKLSNEDNNLLAVPHTYHSNFLNELLKEIYNKMLKINPQEADTFFARGIVNFDLYQRGDALEDFDKAKQLFKKENDQSSEKNCDDKIAGIKQLKNPKKEELFLCFKVPV